jgi:hypothetical protein
MRALFFGGLVVSTLLLGCGGESTNGSASTTGDGPPQDPNDITFQTGQFVAPPGDSLTCFYLDTKTTKELSVTGAKAMQGPGGHHVIIYWIDEPRSAQHHTCTDAEMVSWHQIAGAANNSNGAEGLLALPEGAALKVPPGKQLGIQAHYINASPKAETVDDSITIHTMDPSDVKEYVNYYAMNNDTFVVPPHGSLKQASTCTTTQELKNVLLLGHMHEYGTHYKLETLDANGKSDKTLYEEAWYPLYTTHPPLKTFPLDAPLTIAKGTTLQQTCEWVNTSAEPLAFPTEMCVAFFYYYPDNGELNCEATPVAQ